ncbi:hypothetical protein [Aureimonas glaciei]|uniref:Uncharacterized protein n=1 Tax=Aureimonas glaciei TaxID=1776957 RepID=A0A916V1I1_9HYPH|nr:hypothetical protein [Aureimonas glaciei]GGD02118.1 hypothetical protein GCM10011335_00910 [Aureimonas glaciei]
MDKGKPPETANPTAEDAAKTATNEAERHKTGETPAKAAAQKK